VARDKDAMTVPNDVDEIMGATIAQLRTYCPFFENRIAGAADYVQGLQRYNETMPKPVAFVLPLSQEAEPNSQMTGLQQIIHKEFGIVVELDARNDRRGQDPAMSYAEIESALMAALINWSPANCRVPNGQGYQFGTGMFLDLDRNRLFYQWSFRLPYQITELDGWQGDQGVPLEAVELDIYKAPPWSMPPPPPEEPAAVAVVDMQPQAPLTVGPNMLVLGVGIAGFVAATVLGTGIDT
jgi:hypothetical protein